MNGGRKSGDRRLEERRQEMGQKAGLKESVLGIRESVKYE